MPQSHNLQEAINGLIAEYERFAREQRKTANKIIIQAMADLQRESPMDKGLFRASHTLSIGNPPIGTPKRYEDATKNDSRYTSEADRQLESARAELQKLIERNGAEPVFIGTHLEYAEALEHGHSIQAT